MNEISISKIIYREDLYPRFKLDQKLIEKYADSVEYLPPIKINQSNILIDGLHRMRACQLAKKVKIKCDVVETKSEKELKKLAYQWNSKHGLQLSSKEKSTFANEMIGETNIDELAEILSVTPDCINKWTKNKRKELEEQRDQKILDLYLKAENTQEKVAESVEVSDHTVSDVLKKFRENNKFIEISETFEPYLYNIWSLHKKSEEDLDFFGVFPQIYMENLIYYHTEPYDIVYDPFAGSGTTIDVCQKWLRRYYCSDMNARPGREDVMKKWKIQQGIPKNLPLPDLVFLDPSYWIQAKEQYSKSPDDLANMSLDKFYDTFLTFLGLLLKWKVKRIAIVIQPTQYANNLEYEDHILEFAEFLSSKYRVEMRYILPYSSQQYNPQQVDKIKEEKKCLVLHRDLIVWRLR